jgi:hypothetical protein
VRLTCSRPCARARAVTAAYAAAASAAWPRRRCSDEGRRVAAARIGVALLLLLLLPLLLRLLLPLLGPPRLLRATCGTRVAGAGLLAGIDLAQGESRGTSRRFGFVDMETPVGSCWAAAG